MLTLQFGELEADGIVKRR
ncbi:hypothetical protein MT997_22360 [Paenibacillus sp. OVF10]|nr:hypothetical protein MT997_22360 [Paenibacillus sp. OVF10]